MHRLYIIFKEQVGCRIDNIETEKHIEKWFAYMTIDNCETIQFY